MLGLEYMVSLAGELKTQLFKLARMILYLQENTILFTLSVQPGFQRSWTECDNLLSFLTCTQLKLLHLDLQQQEKAAYTLMHHVSLTGTISLQDLVLALFLK